MSLQEYNSKKADLLKKMQQAVKPRKTKEDYTDNRFWNPASDKAGNKNAIIRFLPSPDTELPWVDSTKYSFHDGTRKRWYIENYRRLLKDENGKELSDPVYDLNGYHYNIGTEESKKNAKRRKLTRKYISNVLVVTDTINPENNGKVFLYEYTQGIFDTIQSKIQGEYLKNDKGEVLRDENGDPQEIISDPSNPFDYLEGSNFAVVYTVTDDKESGMGNYKKSKFLKDSALFGGDMKKLEEIHNQLHPLAPFLAEDNFKSYEDLKKRLMYVEGLDYWPLDENDVEKEDVIKKIISDDSESDTTPTGSIPEAGESSESFFENLSGDIEIDFD